MIKKLNEQSLRATSDVIGAYAELSYDYNPLHIDAEFAATTPFGARIAHGAMALDLLLNAVDDTFGQDHQVRIDIRFTAPVKIGDRITAGGEVSEEAFAVWVRKDDGSDVLRGTMAIGDCR
ncbi:MaoC family dehydratase [Rhodobacteraceae bacterium D3-12]|nr:MaoC family dehydratase [Rhodobacteraceae bacterium D3-12]